MEQDPSLPCPWKDFPFGHPGKRLNWVSGWVFTEYLAGYWAARVGRQGARLGRFGGRDSRIEVARLGAMELFDWYWLGVSAGLGVAAGTAAGWIQSAGPRVLGAIAFAIAALVGIFVAFFVAGWGPAIWAGAATLAWIALRRLTRAAGDPIRPALMVGDTLETAATGERR